MLKKSLGIALLILSLSFSAQAEECKQEGYELEVAEAFLWLLKGNSEKVTNEQYDTAYQIYETLLLTYEKCTKASS